MKKYAQANIEPPLAELLGDPIVDLVLARDRISRSELDALIDMVQRDLDRTGSRSATADRCADGNGAVRTLRSQAS